MHTGSDRQGNAPAGVSCRSHGPAAEKPAVSKSLLAVGALGAGSCMLLGWMMQHLLQVQQERTRSPLAQILEVQLERRRVGPGLVSEVRERGRLRISVRLSVLAGLQKKSIAESVGAVTWNHILAAGTVPAEVVVEVGDDEQGPVTVLAVPRPARPY